AAVRAQRTSRKPAGIRDGNTHSKSRSQTAFMSAQAQGITFGHQHRNMVHVEPLQQYVTHHRQQLIEIDNRSRLPGYGVDCLKLIGATTLQGIETGILQRHGSLRGEQREQVDHLRVEIVKLLTLEIEYAHDLLADHQWNRQLRLCFRDILYITWIFR